MSAGYLIFTRTYGMRRGHHELATVEAIGLLAMLVPLVLRPFGEKLKAIIRRPSGATKGTP